MVSISVVIPCRNEVLFIEECVRAIFASEISDDVQLNVFVVDGMSNDGTREKVQTLQSEFQGLNLVDNKQQLTPFAFNLGIHAAKCDYAQIVGARHILSKNYIAKSLQILKSDDKIWCVGGKIKNEYINETGRVIASAMGTSLGMGLGNFRDVRKIGVYRYRNKSNVPVSGI